MRLSGWIFMITVLAYLRNILICLSLLSSSAYASEQNISLSPQDIHAFGEKVFANECAGRNECLLRWNKGEDFLSLGIGHFIWYPKGKRGPFEESFPKLIQYLRSTGHALPQWLDTRTSPKCPWNSRDEFLANRQSPKAIELRQLLLTTKPQQSIFIVGRLKEALPLLLKHSPPGKREEVRTQFNRVAATPAGVFAVVDYINFKGLGILRSERYQGKGWGLLQILSEMQGKEDGLTALEEFVQIAKGVLAERVHHSPRGRDEQRWLPGWQKRVESYLN